MLSHYNNNNIFYCGLMYHRHKSTNAHYKNGVCTRPALRGAKHFILTRAVLSFARAQKMDIHAVAHHTTGVSTCPTLRGAKHFNRTPYFVHTWCVHSVHIFLLHKSNTDVMQTPRQFTKNYCSWSPSYRSVE